MRLYGGPVHGALDGDTREAIKRFRYRWMLPVSHVIDDALIGRLEQALEARINPLLSAFKVKTVGPPSDDDFMRIAERLGIDAATLGAVIDVEAPPVWPAFGADGRPFIIFERHMFSKLTKGRFDASNPNVSNARFDIKQYPRDQSGRWAQFEEAFALDADAAMKATSWGRFSILGRNHRGSGFETVGELAHFVSESESNQDQAVLLGFIVGLKLADPLQRHDWEAFARRYNGPGSIGARYAGRLREAYERRVAAVLGEAPAGALKEEQR